LSSALPIAPQTLSLINNCTASGAIKGEPVKSDSGTKWKNTERREKRSDEFPSTTSVCSVLIHWVRSSFLWLSNYHYSFLVAVHFPCGPPVNSTSPVILVGLSIVALYVAVLFSPSRTKSKPNTALAPDTLPVTLNSPKGPLYVPVSFSASCLNTKV